MKIKSSKILVIGDVMIDRYVIGQHNRNSPEADCAIIDYTRTEDRLGGAANVAYNLAKLNQDVSLVSVTGDDNGALLLSQLCEENNIKLHKVTDNKRPTTIKTRYVDESYKQYLRLDHELTESVDEHIEEALLSHISTLATRGIELIIIQDYNKGVITERLINSIQSLCTDNDIKLCVDPKHNNFQILSNCDLFKPNLKELEHQYGSKISPDKDIINEALRKIDITSPDFIFVTLAEHGIYYQNGDSYGIISGISLPSADVSGAGDTVISILAVLLLHDMTCRDMATISNKCGAYVCKKQGVSFINYADFQIFIYE